MPPAAVAAGRVAVGVRAALTRPSVPARPWVGASADELGARVFGRALGARDIALGLGALTALLKPSGSGTVTAAWVAAGALSDALDTAITAGAWPELPRGTRWLIAGSAGGAGGCAGRGRDGGPGRPGRREDPPAACGAAPGRYRVEAAAACIAKLIALPRPGRPGYGPRVGHVEVAHVSHVLPDGRVLLDDVSFRVGEGITAALVGPNGAGKTTLLRMVAGDLEL